MTASREVVEAAIATTAPKATIVGAAAMGAGWLTVDTMVTLIGAAVAILGGWATWWFKLRADRRAAERRAEEHAEHERRMAYWDRMIASGSPITPSMARQARELGIQVRANDVHAEDEA